MTVNNNKDRHLADELSVCVVIVTFNRKELLMRTLTSINNQSIEVNKIILVDNFSTDGTSNLLEEQGYLEQENFQYHKLSNNTGGAGGFHHGVKLAFEQGYDWIWMMDDDGYPNDTCLKSLLRHNDKFDFYGPLVMDDKGTDKVSFPLRLKNKKIVRTKKQAIESSEEGFLKDVLAPFNGVLVRGSLIKEVGYPKAEFFIWGDEINFWLRCKKQNARIATISDIEFYHPTAPNLGTPMMFGKMQFNDTDSKIKLYCLCRNNTYNLKNYCSRFLALLFLFKTLWFYSFTKPSFKKLKFCLPALLHGWKEDFTHHHKYIGKNF